ncbi:hypothetical protein HOP52_00085 [Halomonas campisalis]|uniref:Uncharacterized protein n=1 Tax=Billgrantia campisalis TaxID=74661 RepID=A0ABS9P327_9GAMM|nr:hypothetical protein [Halomonas campisalis]MCG6656180.1 hypothetical protein [Halomonas campisalis]MDR5861366.1 hypothetical protein [Halomonas campisalis]
MQEILLPMAMAATFGAFTGSLFRLSRRPGYQRPFMFPVVGLIAGFTAYLIYHVLVSVTGAPAWLLPVLVVLQVWLWLGPLGPKFKRQENGDNGQ